eukprot:gb/GECH01006695.1/.p1 GENE.gb/GECH01006695.1/~~gb/GECH01006695.1/.p1  ORF type:complete len:363 (+),score=69.31 gb/GECH01006695.1/:1-1089(+)
MENKNDNTTISTTKKNSPKIEESFGLRLIKNKKFQWTIIIGINCLYVYVSSVFFIVTMPRLASVWAKTTQNHKKDMITYFKLIPGLSAATTANKTVEWITTEKAFTIFNLVAGIYLFICSVTSFWKCVLFKHDKPKSKSKDNNHRNSDTSFPKNCLECNSARKNKRTYHCNQCDQCIEELDHHCVAVNNCISSANILSFCKMLGFTFLGSLYAYVGNITLYYLYWDEIWNHFEWSWLPSFFATFACHSGIASTVTLIAVQIYLAACNYKSWEFFILRKHRKAKQSLHPRINQMREIISNGNGDETMKKVLQEDVEQLEAVNQSESEIFTLRKDTNQGIFRNIVNHFNLSWSSILSLPFPSIP